MHFKKDKITGDLLGIGRRKSAVARVRLRAGSGLVLVNGRALTEYFKTEKEHRQITDTLEFVGQRNAVDLSIRCTGGGPAGQAQACKMGIARALCGFGEEMFQPLRDNGFLTRDSRMKERKKYGQKGARARFQFSKR